MRLWCTRCNTLPSSGQAVLATGSRASSSHASSSHALRSEPGVGLSSITDLVWRTVVTCTHAGAAWQRAHTGPCVSIPCSCKQAAIERFTTHHLRGPAAKRRRVPAAAGRPQHAARARACCDHAAMMHAEAALEFLVLLLQRLEHLLQLARLPARRSMGRATACNGAAHEAALSQTIAKRQDAGVRAHSLPAQTSCNES